METWAKVKEFGRYSVSNRGRCKNDITGRILKQFTTKAGYKRVNLYNMSGNKTCRVHRLVLIAFDPRADQDVLHVNHKNHDPSDNRLSNLEWMTFQENIDHSRSDVTAQAFPIYQKLLAEYGDDKLKNMLSKLLP